MPANAASSLLPAAVRGDVERWFVKRGVPQFIEGYGTEQSMDARAAPLITGWIVALDGQLLARPTGGPVPVEARGAIGPGRLAFVIGADVLVDTLRGRSPWRLPPKFDLVDIGLFAALPVVPTLLVQRDPLGVLFSVLNILLGIGVIYVVIGFGLLDIAGWAARPPARAAGPGRDAPLADAAAAADPGRVPHVRGGALGGRPRAERGGARRRAGAAASWSAACSSSARSGRRCGVSRRSATGTSSARRRAGRPPKPSPGYRSVRTSKSRPLAWLERRNIEFVVLVNQLLQSTFVSLIVMAFLSRFGLIVVPASVQATWIGGPVTALAEFELIGEVRVLSAELLGVSGLLGGIVGLYFTGLSLTDATYRADHVTSVVAELRTVISARALYRAALHASGGGRAGVPPT